MTSPHPIRHVVLDFDGTCTLVPVTADAYLAEYLRLFKAEACPEADAHWQKTFDEVHAASPELGWMLHGAAPSSPIAADPYMMAGEVATRILRATYPGRPVPPTLHKRAYDGTEAPWRAEMADVLEALVGLDVTVDFVSNSSSATITSRLDHLLEGRPHVRKGVRVKSDAAKFSIQELPHPEAVAEPLRRRFLALDPGLRIAELGRPIYLRRGQYFDALARIWGADEAAIASTLVCGDVFELDLAMPSALGCQVHLIEREAPYATSAYERRLAEERGAMSVDLRGMLERVKASRAR